MEQNTLHKQTAKMIAVIAVNMPSITEARMQFLIEHPSILKEKLWTALMYDLTKEQELFLDTPLNYHILEMDEPNIHDFYVRVFSACKKWDIKTLKELMFISRTNPPSRYQGFFKFLGTKTYNHMVEEFTKHGLTLPE
jgi:hypothetical protein